MSRTKHSVGRSGRAVSRAADHGTTSERLSSPLGPLTAIVAMSPLTAHASYGPDSGTDLGVPAIVSVADVAPIDVHWNRRGD
jgi:hypothetical protein